MQLQYRLIGASPEEVIDVANGLIDLMSTDTAQGKQLRTEALAIMGRSSDNDAELLTSVASKHLAVQTPEGMVTANEIIVAFLPVAAEITLDLWRYFILPRLQNRFPNSIKLIEDQED
jgi:hypothetical protein